MDPRTCVDLRPADGEVFGKVARFIQLLGGVARADKEALNAFFGFAQVPAGGGLEL